MLDNRSIYSEEYSVIGNPFDAKLALTKVQLLQLFVLTALVNYGSAKAFQHSAGEDTRGALEISGSVTTLRDEYLKISAVLGFAYTASHSEPSFEASFQPSRLGGYIVRNLIGSFAYLEAAIARHFSKRV